MGISDRLASLHAHVYPFVYSPIMAVADRVWFDSHRAYLARGLSGNVLDIGAGTGHMLQYLVSDDTTVHAIDIDRRMLTKTEHQRERIERVQGDGQHLPYDDGTFDYVIASLVLCTVTDQRKTLDEVARVLKPDGELRVFEHVRAGGIRGYLQRCVAPTWYQLTHGCHLERDTSNQLMTHQLFDEIELVTLHIGIWPVRPFIRGRFQRREPP